MSPLLRLMHTYMLFEDCTIPTLNTLKYFRMTVDFVYFKCHKMLANYAYQKAEVS